MAHLFRVIVPVADIDVVPDVGPLGKIAQRPWGERSFYAADPFGNPLCFVARDSVFTGRGVNGKWQFET
jgi:hypothetical protein